MLSSVIVPILPACLLAVQLLIKQIQVTNLLSVQKDYCSLSPSPCLGGVDSGLSHFAGGFKLKRVITAECVLFFSHYLLVRWSGTFHALH